MGLKRRRVTGALFAAVGLLTITGCGETPELTAPGFTWHEAFYEHLGVDLPTGQANCVADHVGSVADLLRPIGMHGDMTVLGAAVDACLSSDMDAAVARGIVLGSALSADEAGVTPAVWKCIATNAADAVDGAGGWTNYSPSLLADVRGFCADRSPEQGEQP